ncbi:hypothetical protein DNU06_08630 [Putridiphycobacter roseus]|uniref:Glycosyltransferase family 1 protein n=1 Tax=Putridiphycobacter roseus TaxID=2219161 RepID=A0A2W1ND42_9FLAO|nr:glycosyltransferase [Putridiphycobacter roseus]PZE17325.1 hypothetical protein DNU06_08630 [Putridiphycobacter roseus]
MTKKVKILRIINRFNLGGPTYNVTFLTAFLNDDFETLLLGGEPESQEGDAMFIPQKYGVSPTIIPELQRSINWKQDRAAYKKIKAIMQEYQPDIVHTHASKSGAIGRLAAINLKVPVIVHTFHGHVFHSYFGKLKTQVYKTVERYLAKRSSAIIAISEQQKHELVNIHRIAKSDKVKVVNLGFDLSKFQSDMPQKRQDFSEKYEVSDAEICVGIIGRLTAIKNHDLFFDVIQEVASRSDKKIHFFIIGDGELKSELEKKAKQLLDMFPQIRITFTSWIKDVSIPLARLDIVCLTSLNEGTPVSLIEAQAAGVPVITTNVGGVKDIIHVGVTGLIVSSFDAIPFGTEILRLIEGDKLRTQMSQEGWAFVKEKFHFKTLCFNIESLYLDLLKNDNV